jgi:ethanolamine ammonia-lyase large subunit
LKTLLARATPPRSGDRLAELAAADMTERVAAQLALAQLPLRRLIEDPVLPYETDEITRLIIDSHDGDAFAAIAAMTVGELRDWLLSDAVDTAALAHLVPGLTPEIVAAVSKLMRLQDLISVAAKCRVVTRFRNTIGLQDRLSTRLQPNHPTDDVHGIAASILDGLILSSGDAVIGINPATDSLEKYLELTRFLDGLRARLDLPGQSCVLAHVTTALAAIERGAPVDLVFQSVAGTEAANRHFGVNLALLGEARDAALSLGRGTARAFDPLLVNSVVGFIGPEYLFDGKEIIRAGLEDHFCGKLLGLPMGCDVCYTNHAEADQDDMDALLTLLGVAGCTYIMGVPGADDVMLSYQSSSFHDALYLRRVLGKRPAPEFEAWLERIGITDSEGRLTGRERPDNAAPLQRLLVAIE